MRYYLGLGSNLGDSKLYLRRALELLEQKNIGKVGARSHLYLTAPIGGPDQPWFLNGAAVVESGLKPEAMLEALLGIELELGRTRRLGEKNFPRTIDLDILLADEMVLKKPELQIPHPRMRERRFALMPLSEIAGEIKDPEQGITVRGILEGLKDDGRVKKLDEIL